MCKTFYLDIYDIEHHVVACPFTNTGLDLCIQVCADNPYMVNVQYQYMAISKEWTVLVFTGAMGNGCGCNCFVL